MESNWLEKLFINEAKPALKRHSGSGGGKAPVLTELTVTENGVYDKPVIGGALDFSVGKTVTFKAEPSVADIPSEFYGTLGTKVLATTTIFDSNGLVMCYFIFDPDTGALNIMTQNNSVEGYIYLNEAGLIANAQSNQFPVTVAGWHYINTTTGESRPLDEPPSIVVREAINQEYQENLAKLSCFFDAPSIPADGWNKVTVNVPSSGGMELNIAYGDTPPEDTSKLWVKCEEPSGVIISTSCKQAMADGFDLQTSNATLRVNTCGLYCGAIGDKIYGFGGQRPSYYSKVSAFCYDTITAKLDVLSVDLPSHCSGTAGAVKGSKIYMFGGYNFNSSTRLSHILCFDADSMTIEQIGDLPIGISHQACAIIGDIIYLFGGYTTDSTNSIYAFDTTTYELTLLNVTIPKYTYSTTAVVVDSYIYLVGGFSGGEVYRFDTLDLTIQTVGVLDASVHSAGAIALGSRIYVIGGRIGNNGVNTVRMYDTLTNVCETTSLTLPDSIFDMGYALIGGTVYLFGGDKNYSSAVNAIQRISFSILKYVVGEGDLFIKHQSNRDTFRLFNTELLKLDLPVHSVYKGGVDGLGEQVEAALFKDGAWKNI